MAILHSHHIAMRTPDWPRAKAFYTETLGFPIKGEIAGRNVVFIDIGGTTIELVAGQPKPGQERPGTGLMHLAWEVDDVDATYADLKAKGVPFFIEPKDAGNIRIAFFRDPDGNELELFKCPTLSWVKK